MRESDLTPIQQLRYQQAYDCVTKAGGVGVTVNDVAECLGVKPTPYLRDMLADMSSWGWVRRDNVFIQTKRGLRMGWKYYPIPSAS